LKKFVRKFGIVGQWNRFMKRFVITVLVATLLHAGACILAPPFEFAKTRPACFLYACISGLIGFPVVFALVLVPLRAGLRRIIPEASRQAHAILAGVVLYALRAALILRRQLSGSPALPFQHGYLSQWIFWSVFVVAITISFFWPFDVEAGCKRQPVNLTTTAI
jgi:uncharacterized YccA/Bax inhibitor family protein